MEDKKIKASVKVRYEKEYEFGLKHQAVLQLINTVGRQIVYQDLLTKILIDSGYCTNASRLLSNLEKNKLIKKQKKDGFNLIKIRKLGILVAENQEDMDSVSGRGKNYDQDNRDERIEFRLNYFYYKYVQRLKMPLNDAMKDVFENNSHTLFNNPLSFYEFLREYTYHAERIKEIDKQINHIKLIKANKSKEMASLKTTKKLNKTEKVDRKDTFERFARRDIFIDSCIATQQNELIANIVVFNIADDFSKKKVTAIRDMIALLSELGGKNYTITIVNRTDKLASRFCKNNKVDLPFQFAYFDDDFNMKFINTCENSEQIAVRLEKQYADRIERERREQLEYQRKIEQQRQIKMEREAKLKSNKYYNYDFSEDLTDTALIEWIAKYFGANGFENYIDFILKNKDDFNEMESDMKKLCVTTYDEFTGKASYYSYWAFKSFLLSDGKNFITAFKLYLKWKNEILLNRKIKKFKQFVIEFNRNRNELVVTESESVYKKTKDDLKRGNNK